MSLPDSLRDLLNSAAYPHTCEQIELIETHISWVLLTGEFVYKLKKPVQFSFLDFSTLALREHFCREELRCNRSFAPALYLDVVPIIRHTDASLSVGDSAEDEKSILEWAVKMRQFDPAAQLDRLLETGVVTKDMLAGFGRELAARHAELPHLEASAEELEPRTFGPARDNFAEITATGLQSSHNDLLNRTQDLSNAIAQRRSALITDRLREGFVRECHGDLHLSNLALIDDTVTAFDCLEFNPLLRWIDTLNDVAFLFMDCHERDRADLAYAFLNSYLNASGDYQGAELLTFFAAYRSMVRAKVAALRWEQDRIADSEARFVRHVEWAHTWLSRPTGTLVLMCGLSGSGKSYVAERLASVLPAIQLRSDVARKTLAGLDTLAQTDSPVGGGLYAQSRSDEVFEYLAETAAELLQDGENVIVDATFIELRRRQTFLTLAATLDTRVKIIFCDAPEAVLRERIKARAAEESDPSEATLDVLDSQLLKFAIPVKTEPVITISTDKPLDEAAIATLAGKLLNRPGLS